MANLLRTSFRVSKFADIKFRAHVLTSAISLKSYTPPQNNNFI